MRELPNVENKTTTTPVTGQQQQNAYKVVGTIHVIRVQSKPWLFEMFSCLFFALSIEISPF